VTNGEETDPQRPRSQPPTYEPPSWDAYFGAEEPAAQAGADAGRGSAHPGADPRAGEPRAGEPVAQANFQRPPYAQPPGGSQPPQPPPHQPSPQQHYQQPYQQPYDAHPYQQPTYQQQPYQQQPHQQPYAQSYEEQPFGQPDDDGNPPRPAWVIPVVIAAVAAAFGVALGVVLGIGSGDPADTTTATSPSASAKPSPQASATEEPTATPPSAELSEAEQITPEQAQQTLSAHGLKLAGTGRAGWSWTDRNGENVLYVTREGGKKSDNKTWATIRVMHAAHLDAKAKVLRTMQDPGRGDCELDLVADYAPDSIKVTDADHDGYAEATVGWYWACRSDLGTFEAKLALLSNGDKYILRGAGIPVEFTPPSDQLEQVPKVSFDPTPGKSSWIDGTYDPTVDLFHTLFVGGTAQ
jgi:hypothetical protein